MLYNRKRTGNAQVLNGLPLDASPAERLNLVASPSGHIRRGELPGIYGVQFVQVFHVSDLFSRLIAVQSAHRRKIIVYYDSATTMPAVVASITVVMIW